MITNEWRGEVFNHGTFFIVTDGEQKMYDELNEYCRTHKNDHVWYYVNPVIPSKKNYRPEFSMEVMTNPEDGIMLFYTRRQ